MPDDAPPHDDGSLPDPQDDGSRPLSRRTTRVFVTVFLIVMIAAAFGSAVFIIQSARNAGKTDRAPDSLQQDTASAPADRP